MVSTSRQQWQQKYGNCMQPTSLEYQPNLQVRLAVGHWPSSQGLGYFLFVVHKLKIASKIASYAWMSALQHSLFSSSIPCFRNFNELQPGCDKFLTNENASHVKYLRYLERIDVLVIDNNSKCLCLNNCVVFELVNVESYYAPSDT